LLAAARRLGPVTGLRALVYETLFGLIASTGMRISEALSLHNEDVNLKYGLLTIHQTKFGKSRQVPMHPSTVAALSRYLWMQPCPTWYEPERGAYFQRGMSLKRMAKAEWVDHPEDGDQHE
jgi:integrase